jgi:hypothetical protein
MRVVARESEPSYPIRSVHVVPEVPASHCKLYERIADPPVNVPVRVVQLISI